MPGNTRCKFRCDSRKVSGGPGVENHMIDFEFAPVVGSSGNEENKNFWKWTPSGKLEFRCVNPNVDFEVGKEYYLDISPAG